MPGPIILRDADVPALLSVVRLGSTTLADKHLVRSCEESYGRWGIWGFSVLEVPGGDYQLLARLRPIVAGRRFLLEADGRELIGAGFPLLPTLDRPHWTVALSEATAEQFSRVRPLFRGPIQNPAWSRGTGSVR